MKAETETEAEAETETERGTNYRKIFQRQKCKQILETETEIETYFREKAKNIEQTNYVKMP